MSQTQRTLDGEEIAVTDDRAARPADAEERTPFGAVYADGDGNRRFALDRCPGCAAPVNPHRWPAERSVARFDAHLADKHDSLADFGEVDVHDDQRKLPLGGEVL